MDEHKQRYRQQLVGLLEKMQSEYDKTVLTMSAGSFGVSALLVKELIGANHAKHSVLLFLAWFSWGTAIAACLYSFLSSSMAMESQISKLDNGDEPVPGVLDQITRVLNYVSGILFVAGLGLFSIFTFCNL